MMKRDKAYFIGLHQYHNRRGEPAEIIGIEMITPNDCEPRLCYHVQWADKEEDWFPVHIDTKYHKIVSFSDILAGNLANVLI